MSNNGINVGIVILGVLSVVTVYLLFYIITDAVLKHTEVKKTKTYHNIQLINCDGTVTQEWTSVPTIWLNGNRVSFFDPKTNKDMVVNGTTIITVTKK